MQGLRHLQGLFEGVLPGFEGEGFGNFNISHGEHLPGGDVVFDDGVAHETNGKMIGHAVDEDGFTL